MTDTILIVIWPFASALLISIAELILSRTKRFGGSHVKDLKLPKILRQIKWKDKTGNTALSFLIIWTAALLQFLFSMASLFAVRKFAYIPSGSANAVHPAIFAVADIVSDICILYLLRSQKRTAARAAVIIAVISYAALSAELFLFNFNCFKADPHSVYFNGSSITPEFASDANEDGAVRYKGNSILVRADCSLMLHDVPDDTYSVTVRFSRPSLKSVSRFKCRLLIEDRNSMHEYRTTDVRKVSGLNEVTLFMKPYGNIKSVMLSLEGLKETVRIDSVTVADCNVYGAMLTRYLFVLLISTLITPVFCFRLYDVEFDPSVKLHAVLLSLAFILTSGVTYMLYQRKDMKFDKYPFEDNSEILDIYQLEFDSKMKKIPYLDIPVSSDLKELNNPYDASERDAKESSYRWDYCYKDGKYYSYYGIAPIYTFYFPVYLLSHRVPNYSSAVGIIGTVSVVAVVLAFLAAVRMFVPKKNLLALILLIPAVAAASFAYNNMVYSEKYYVACCSATAAIGFTVFFGLSAVMGKKRIGRLVMFFLSGLSLAVCAGSRPTVAVCAAALLPAFFGVLTDRTRKLISRLSEAAVFIVPVIAGIALILMHNYERFGNLLDFGENYQLTVSDISSLKATPEMFPSAVFYYFLMPLNAIETFPFIEARGIISNTYEIYRNIEPSTGILNIPLLFCGLIFTPGAFVRAKGKVTKREAWVFNGFIIVCILTALFITWFDFSRGGVCIRYLSDFSWLLAISGGVILLRRIMRRTESRTFYWIVCLSCILTVITVFLIILSFDSCNMTKLYPALLEKCEDFFIFWH